MFAICHSQHFKYIGVLKFVVNIKLKTAALIQFFQPPNTTKYVKRPLYLSKTNENYKMVDNVKNKQTKFQSHVCFLPMYTKYVKKEK